MHFQREEGCGALLLGLNPHHDDIIKWKHFPRYWTFVRGIHRHRWIPAQRPVTRSFYVFFDLRLNERLSNRWRDWWFETPSRSLWRYCNVSRTIFHIFFKNTCVEDNVLRKQFEIVQAFFTDMYITRWIYTRMQISQKQYIPVHFFKSCVLDIILQ